MNIIYTAQPPKAVRWGIHKTPYGPMLLGLTEKGALCFFEFAKGRNITGMLKEKQKRWKRTSFAKDQRATQEVLQKIFAKAKKGSIKVHLTGTSFQQKVWKALLAIPAGKVESYAALARRIKKPKAVRAVGTALGANPVPILVPCHRVIASDGSLGGFGGGLTVKRQLLQGERVKKETAFH